VDLTNSYPFFWIKGMLLESKLLCSLTSSSRNLFDISIGLPPLKHGEKKKFEKKKKIVKKMLYWLYGIKHSQNTKEFLIVPKMLDVVSFVLTR
jgi:hypothetical protein